MLSAFPRYDGFTRTTLRAVEEEFAGVAAQVLNLFKYERRGSVGSCVEKGHPVALLSWTEVFAQLQG